MNKVIKNKKPFFMMRHGITVANREGSAAGSLDTPLTETGRAQAEQTEATIFALQNDIDYIVHSGLSRSRDTALIINRRLQKPLHMNVNLKEQNFGDWAGTPFVEVMRRVRSGETPPRGEALDAFHRRALQGMDEALSLAPGKPLIVSHGGIFDAFFSHHGFAEPDVENCALYNFMPTAGEAEPFWLITQL